MTRISKPTVDDEHFAITLSGDVLALVDDVARTKHFHVGRTRSQARRMALRTLLRFGRDAYRAQQAGDEVIARTPDGEERMIG